MWKTICLVLLCAVVVYSSGGRRHGKLVKRLKKVPVRTKSANTAARLFGWTGPTLNQTDDDEARQRFLNPFSLFNVVQFPNTECTTDSGGVGTCYTGQECADRGGVGKGSCAGGFGVCCLFSTPCNSETAENGTYFSSPTSLNSVCSIMIRPMDDDICQVRLDFEELVLMDPDDTGNCRVDYLQLTGGVSNSRQMPTLCGVNTGQHVIYSAIPSFPARLSVVVDTQMTGVSRSWRIKISQFSCSSPALAPEGCLQYYTGISGNVSSFNWKLTDNTMDPTLSNHIANLGYSVCIRRESGYCAVEWSTPSPYDSQNGYFSLTGSEQTASLTSADVQVGDTDCRTDYVMIPGGWGGTDMNNQQFSRDRFCGQALGYCTQDSCNTKALGSVRSYVTPFILGVVTDLSESSSAGGTTTTTRDSRNRGFNLNYRQHPCS